MTQVSVPRELLERISELLGSFCSDHGWAQADMDVMDSVDALLAQSAPQPPKCACCGTTENLLRDVGSGGPYRCNSADCVVF